MEQRSHLLIQAPYQVGGNRAEHHFRGNEGFGEIAGDPDVRRQMETGEVDVVDPGLAHALGQIRLINPESEVREPGRQNESERRAPASAADNRKILQSLNTFSVPSRSRSMLPLCL